MLRVFINVWVCLCINIEIYWSNHDVHDQNQIKNLIKQFMFIQKDFYVSIFFYI